MSEFLQALDTQQKTVGAVVLSGGLARRMGGQDKGLIELGGRAMASWVIDVVKPAVHQLVINANRNESEYRQLGAEVIGDRHEGHIGPLAGLSTAMHSLKTDYVFMCPCDSPFIEKSLINALGLACLNEQVDIAVARDAERMQPVFCIAHKCTLDSLDAYLDSGERKIDRWYATQRLAQVDCSAWSGSFRNINTEEERQQAQSELS